MTVIGINNLSNNIVISSFNDTKILTKPKPKESKLDNFLNFFDRFTLGTKFKEVSKVNFSFLDDNKTINKNTKVLIIGDSQTVGSYGANLDKLVRGTNAKVVTYASWGSSPEWWFSGKSATAGFWSKGIDGKEFRTKEHQTPNIEKILSKEKPDIVIVTMGGNMMKNATQASVSKQVDKLGNAITNSGAKLFWAGPPKYDPKKRTPEELKTFYGFLAKAVSSHGTFIDSRKFINEYHGQDGLHYSGRKGKKETEKWAKGVFKEIQSANRK
ncbi:MAG: hypothetical protein U0354_00790 [Candidatus Sericytochromatia bacterium]